MARYIGGNNNAKPVLEAIDHWKTSSLLSDNGIFEDREVWNTNYLQKLDSIVEQLDNKDFYLNFNVQLEKSGESEIIQLAAEICWFVHLCPSHTAISQTKKRDRIRNIWKLSNTPFPENSKFLKDDTLKGIGSPGTFFKTNQKKEWKFFIQFTVAFKKLPRQQHGKYLKESNCWEFAEWLDGISESGNPTLRHMILFLFFPENFERIFSGKDKKEIVEAFTGEYADKMPMLKIDKLIFDIRRQKEKEHGNSQLDFYNDPLEKEWKYPEANPFPWIRFYESMAEKLLDFKNKREELVEKIHEITEQVPALSGLQDKFKNGTTGPLKDICPFTTIGIFNQGHTFENRKIIATKLANSLEVSEPIPESFDGIPVVSSQNAWFFSYDKDRHRDDIDTLWEVFDQALKLAESDEMNNRSAFISAYDKALKCRGVGWNLTMGLYWIHALSFPTLDRRSRDYIEKELGIKIPKKYPDVTATEYLQIRDTLRSRFLEDKCPVNSFPDLSLAAWLSGSEHSPDPKKDETKENDAEIEHATNLILYGPPGTGKTYRLNKLKEKYSGGTQTQSRKTWLMGELLDTPWFNVIFAALHDLGQKTKVSAISEHEYVQAKAESVGRVKYVKNTIWAVLQAHASEDAEFVKFKNLGQFPAVFDKTENSFWFLVNDWEEECKNIVELSKKWKDGPNQESANERFEFVTFHQAYSYEDFIEGLRPVQDEETGNIKYEIVPGVFKRICSRAKANPEQRYAIFIDEINRGNIASIFGELITLLESDKRVIYGEDGSPESGMALTLPYSGERFGVPANLDVYGTMNTADRSIALIDTALRRRFQFQEMMPDTSVINGSSGNGLIEDGEGGIIDLRRLLETINSRIRFLLSRDMTIGHSYLINVQNFDDLKNALYAKIIPLLQEYFYDDWHRIQLVFRDVGANGEKLEPQIIRHVEMKEEEIIGFDHADFEDSTEYRVTPEDGITPDAIRKVYEEKITPDA